MANPTQFDSYYGGEIRFKVCLKYCEQFLLNQLELNWLFILHPFDTNYVHMSAYDTQI